MGSVILCLLFAHSYKCMVLILLCLTSCGNTGNYFSSFGLASSYCHIFCFNHLTYCHLSDCSCTLVPHQEMTLKKIEIQPHDLIREVYNYDKFKIMCFVWSQYISWSKNTTRQLRISWRRQLQWSHQHCHKWNWTLLPFYLQCWSHLQCPENVIFSPEKM